MAKFYIDSTALKKSPRQIDEIYKVLNSSEKILKNISLTNWPEAEMQSLADSVGEIAKDVKDEAKSVQDLSEVLSKIITTYEDSEASLVAKKDTVDQNKVPGENAQDEKQNQKSDMTPEMIAWLEFLGSLIPGVNIALDFKTLWKDIDRFYLKDHSIDMGEAVTLAWDLVSLGLDISAFGSVCKAIKGAKTVERFAKAAAKETTRVAEKNVAKKEAAEKIAKTAAKRSAEATDKARKAAKAAENASKATKAGRRAVKSADMAARNADKAEKSLKSAQRAAKEASRKSASATARKQAAERTAEEAHRNVYSTGLNEMKKGTESNVKGKLKPTNMSLDEGSEYIRNKEENEEKNK